MSLVCHMVKFASVLSIMKIWRPCQAHRGACPAIGRARRVADDSTVFGDTEGPTKDDVLRVAGLLGYDEDQLTGENTVKVYARYGIDLTAIPDLRLPG
jgi:hypothetical protein